MRPSLLSVLLAVACTGSTSDTSPPTILPPPDTDSSTTTDTTTTTDSLPEGGFIDGTFLAIYGRFAYDPTLGKGVEFAWPGEGYSPLQLEFQLFDSDAIYVGVNETNSCSVFLEFPGPVAAAPWVAKQGAWFGVDVPADATVRNLCQNFGFPSQFEGNVVGQITKWSWGAGISEMSILMRKTLQNSLPDSEWAALQAYAVGGLLKSSIFLLEDEPSEFSDFGYGLAYTVDGNFQVDISGAGNTIPIPAEDVPQEDAVARAFYEVSFGLFNGLALTNEVP